MNEQEIKARVKQNLEDGTTEALCREAGFTDKEVEDILRVCKRAVEGVYGDDIFSPKYNRYLRHLGEIEE